MMKNCIIYYLSIYYSQSSCVLFVVNDDWGLMDAMWRTKPTKSHRKGQMRSFICSKLFLANLLQSLYFKLYCEDTLTSFFFSKRMWIWKVYPHFLTIINHLCPLWMDMKWMLRMIAVPGVSCRGTLHSNLMRSCLMNLYGVLNSPKVAITVRKARSGWVLWNIGKSNKL